MALVEQHETDKKDDLDNQSVSSVDAVLSLSQRQMLPKIKRK